MRDLGLLHAGVSRAFLPCMQDGSDAADEREGVRDAMLLFVLSLFACECAPVHTQSRVIKNKKQQKCQDTAKHN